MSDLPITLKTIKEGIDFLKKWNLAKSDKERIDLLFENKTVCLFLDNDFTSIFFYTDETTYGTKEEWDEFEKIKIKEFDQYFGRNSSLVLLFEKVGIYAYE